MLNRDGFAGRLRRAPSILAALTAVALVVLSMLLLDRWQHDDTLRAGLVAVLVVLSIVLLGLLAHAGTQARLTELNRQLAETERFMRLVTDNIPARLAYWDSERRCLFVNRAGHAAWGKRREDFIGRTSSEIFGQAFTGPNVGYSAAALRGEPQSFEREERMPGGETVITQIDYQPDIRDGRVVGFFSLATDVTRAREAQRRLREVNEQLQQALGRAEASSRAKGEFLSNMSHEIRTPLNAIIGLTHVMRNDIADPVQGERLRKVGIAADHLLRVINDILDLAKIESGRLRLENGDFALGDLLSRVTMLVAEEARDKGIELLIDTGRVPDRLHGDSTRLSQALLNLLGNAIKFTERGTVRLGITLLEHEPPQLKLRFEVSDTGIGIEQAQLDALFMPFQQADGSTTRRFGGTGLGLAITKRIAELMDGEVGAESAPGVGSRFWFSARLSAQVPERDGLGRAPAAPAGAQLTSQPPTEAPAAAADWGAARVLLVEDNHLNRDVAVELLGAAGIVPEVADSGAQAVQMARAAAYDLILMDVQMPGLDGLQATRLLRSGDHAVTAPIVAMTASAFVEDRAACLSAGMNDHIAKPIDPAALRAMLHRWLPPRPASPRTGPAASPDPVPSADLLLRSVAGIDPALALRSCGVAAVAVRAMRQFAVQSTDDGARIRAAFAAGQIDTATRTLHTLKATSGAIGAVRVHQLASALDLAARSNASAAQLQAGADTLAGELQALMHELRRRLPVEG